MCVSNKSPWTSNALDSGAKCGEPLMWPIAVRGSDFIGTPRGHGLPYCLCRWILRSGWKEIVPFPELLKPPWSLKFPPGGNHCPPEPLEVTPGIAPSGPLGWKKIEKLLVFLSVSLLPPIRFYSGTTDPNLTFLWRSSWSPWNTWLRDLMTRVPLLPVHTNSVCTLDCAHQFYVHPGLCTPILCVPWTVHLPRSFVSFYDKHYGECCDDHCFPVSRETVTCSR